MFKKSLQEIQNRIEGCLGVVIMGMDGIPVEQLWQPAGMDANLDVAVAEFTGLVRAAGSSSNDLNLRQLREMSVSFENAAFVMRIINKDYFLVLVLQPEGNFGRARFELRCAEALLKEEFAV